MESLVLENISKYYSKFVALDNISLNIKPGIFGLLGPNGAGKTTLMRIIATLLYPEKGKIYCGNINWEKHQEVRKIIGYLPQKFSLYKHVKVQEALLHIASLKGIKFDKMKQVNGVIERLNLSEQRNRSICSLSEGMVRRLGIAQAILGAPRIIIIDEPTASLDPEERIRFRTLIQNLKQKSIIIISTHIVEDLEVTCDQVGILKDGKLIQYGSINSIREKATGIVWEKIVAEDKFYTLSKKLDIISVHRINDLYKVRVLSKEPLEDAKEVEPTLEDSYIYLIRGVGSI